VRGGALPPALLCAALGFALAFAPRRALVSALIALAVLAIGLGFAPLPEALTEPAFLGCWISVIATAAAMYLPGGVGPRLALVLGANAGLWSGAVVAVAGAPLDLAIALPWALLCLPGGWLVATERSIVLKLLGSWLAAVAILAAGLSFAPVTPGYAPDHME
jgi:hypothetical protein